MDYPDTHLVKNLLVAKFGDDLMYLRAPSIEEKTLLLQSFDRAMSEGKGSIINSSTSN